MVQEQALTTLGHPFNQKTYSLWQMVRQDENEDAPKRVLNNRVKGLELVGTLMEREQKGFLWEHEFRQFILKTVKHYNLTKPLASLKRELEQRGQGPCLQGHYRQSSTQGRYLIVTKG